MAAIRPRRSPNESDVDFAARIVQVIVDHVNLNVEEKLRQLRDSNKSIHHTEPVPADQGDGSFDPESWIQLNEVMQYLSPLFDKGSYFVRRVHEKRGRVK